jgi:hypothetical protein
MILISTLPLIYGWLIRPVSFEFTGIHFAANYDWFVYYSYFEQVRQGHFLFSDLFTSEPSRPVLNLIWLVIGLFGKIFKLSNVVVFNLSRVILIPIFYFFAYLLVAYLFEPAKRKIVLLLLSFGSGLGFFFIGNFGLYPGNFAGGQLHWPMDLWVPELNTFLTLYYTPHFAASLTLMVIIFLTTLIFIENKKISYAFIAGFSGLILFLFHPFHVISVFGVLAVAFLFLIIKDKNYFWPLLKYFLIFLFLSLPAVIYYFYLLRFDFVSAQKALQNNCPTTPLALTLVSYGLILILALIGLYDFLKKNRFSFKSFDSKWLFIVAWFLTQFLIIYFPVNYQRRMTEGLHLPMVFLAGLGFFVLAERIQRRRTAIDRIIFSQRYFLLMLLIFGLVGSNLTTIASDLVIYQTRSTNAYLSSELMAANQWLKENTPAWAVILGAMKDASSVIPAYSGRRVYLGHGVETIHFWAKDAEVRWFFSQNHFAVGEKEFLNKRKINYIFYSDAEKQLGGFSPLNKNYLQPVYQNSKIGIYQVIN